MNRHNEYKAFLAFSLICTMLIGIVCGYYIGAAEADAQYHAGAR